MKTPAEWLNEVGETVMFSAFAGGNPPGKEVEALVKRIQDDAIQSACFESPPTGTPTKDHAMKISELAREASLNSRAHSSPNEKSKAVQSAINTACQPLVEALQLLYDETADYIRVNHLGDVHHNKSMQVARDVLEAHHREHGQEAPILEKPVLPVTKAEVAAWKMETK